MRIIGASSSNEDNNTTFTFDGDVHTASNPYCGDITCWCHTNVSYHDQVQHPTTSDEEMAQILAFLEMRNR